ncbi:MAG: lipocalin-like domain-containing protein [Reyranella sp.]|nr:lipocalin-like domain-containing protein [Reyranella sp.]
MDARHLVGAWRLESWSLVYDDGRAPEFPLGREAKGFIFYMPGGEVSATLMRGGRPSRAPASEREKAAAYEESFAYAGHYEVRDGAVFHSIEVATNPALVGLTSTRHIELDGDRLTLSGPDFVAGSGRTQRIVWRRSSAG